MKHVRITFNQLAVLNPEHASIEYGRLEVVGLTPEERQDYDALEQEFGEATKPEFTKAADLADPAKKERIHRQRRYAELDRKLTEPRMVWMPTDEETMPETVILIMRKGVLPVYIENMPDEMIKKLMSPQIIVENPQVYMAPQVAQPQQTVQAQAQPQPQAQQSPITSPIEKVKALLGVIKGDSAAKKPWSSLVSVELINPAAGIYEGEETKPNRVYVTPLDFLGNDWPPINTALKGAFGAKAIWFGIFKEHSHWELVLE